MAIKFTVIITVEKPRAWSKKDAEDHLLDELQALVEGDNRLIGASILPDKD